MDLREVSCCRFDGHRDKVISSTGEAAKILDWSPERVGNIRKVHVDQSLVVVALAERVDGADREPAANRT